MDALEKEIQQIIDADSSVEETEDESIEEAYKTKDQVKAEVDELLGTMKRSELVDAKEKLTPQEDEEEITEEPDDDTVAGKDAADDADDNTEGDFENLAQAMASLAETDKKKIMAAIDDIENSDDDEEEGQVDESDDSDEDKQIIGELKKVFEAVIEKSKRKGPEGDRLRKAARAYYRKNRARILELAAAARKRRKGKKANTVKLSHFDPSLTREEVDIHVEALLEGEGLSDDFKEKASLIFEGAVNSKVDSTVDNLKEQFDLQLEQATDQIQEDLSTQVDTYLNYVIEHWLEDNKLAVEKGLRTELTEDFIGGLKTLFEQHYIDVPDAKIDVVDDLSERVEELEDKLNAEIDKNIQLVEKLNQSEKEGIIEENAQNLSDVQTEKLKELAEVVDFTTADEFSQKVETIKESYFPSTPREAKKVDTAPDYVGKGGSMERYTQMLSRSIK